MNSKAIPPTESGGRLFDPPGGILVWIIVFIELLTFGIAIGVFLLQKGQDPGTFRAGQAGLNGTLAFVNTVVLLTGGWFMAHAIRLLRSGAATRSLRWIAASALAGVLFLCLKGAEYADKLQQGHDLHHDAFHTLYWLLTGFHFMHVLVAVLLLAAMARGVRRGRYTPENHEDVEGSAIFWHMCDLIWLLLMPVLYLLP
jgi:nitric oxide reductase NorE protein